MPSFICVGNKYSRPLHLLLCLRVKPIFSDYRSYDISITSIGKPKKHTFVYLCIKYLCALWALLNINNHAGFQKISQPHKYIFFLGFHIHWNVDTP